MIRPSLWPVQRGLAFFFAAALVAGCSSSNSGAPGVPPPGTPIVTSASVPVSTSSSSTVALAAVSGVAPTITIPAAAAGSTGTLTVAESATLPSGYVALSGAARHTLALHNSILYVTFTASSTLTLTGNPGFQYKVTSLGTDPIGFAIFTPTNGWTYGAAPVTISGNTITIAPGSTQVTFTAGAQYAFALYSMPSTATAAPSSDPTAIASAAPSPTATATATATAAPSPSPTATPTPVPTATPVPVVSPSALVLTYNPNASSQTTGSFTASEANYTGTFTPSTCKSGANTIATVTGTSPTFTVTPAMVGTCSIAVTNSFGGATSVSVTVNQYNFQINGVKRKL